MTIKINLNEVLKDYEDKDISEQIEESTEIDGKKILKVNRIPLIYKSVFKQAINNNNPLEQRNVDDLVMADGLNVKIYGSDEIELTDDDQSFLLDRVAKIWSSPIIYRRVKDLFKRIN